ncbi:hypothetical protein [Methylobacterium sp. Leaf118]|uniref:hypothetical protein n=1 Tax=Methylobacterium sp. Leaf118 TaxID=2876562 RepID=UPI001E34A5D4|nr:hypothetical protein [Methylobacterium sp. Leaf118]
MRNIFAFGALAMIAGFPLAAQAESGGDRMPAGGAFMSSYQTDPYHDPRSVRSQRAGSGQILGAPMLSENAGVKGDPVRSAIRRGTVAPSWATGSAPTRRGR